MDKVKKNIYQKIQEARVELQEMNLKKSGKNRYAGYNYYELSDFLPAINVLCKEKGLFTAISFEEENAVLRIYDSEEEEKYVEFKSPLKDIEQKGCNAIQNLGSVETYSRRYLYLTAFEIVENDYSEAITGREKKIISKTKEQLSNRIEEYSKLVGKSKEEIVKIVKEKNGITDLREISEEEAEILIKQISMWIYETNRRGVK